ncbi:hypothetical protein LCGC14_1014090, partial [marine sediment metagenome]
QWLKDRLGEGNRFEQFNRRFCKDLVKAQHLDTLRQVRELLDGLPPQYFHTTHINPPFPCKRCVWDVAIQTIKALLEE